MKIVSYNVNGLRAAVGKGLIDWLQEEQPHVVCLQEIKAQPENLDLSLFSSLGYEAEIFSAQKKGYSGTAIFSKLPLTNVTLGTGHEMSDFEGRVLRADIGDLTIVNSYFPSGTTGDVRQQYKYQWLAEWMQYVLALVKERPKLLLCGDYNIAHTEIDLHDPKSNRKTSGFLPEERAWMSQLLSAGFVDTLRHFKPDATGQYTWWTQRFPTVRAQNKGWRLDYFVASHELIPHLESACIYPDAKHSDHCPVAVELSF